ncbi:MAG: hypothetical protein AAB654_21465 [Acidobacteriota bacterium]
MNETLNPAEAAVERICRTLEDLTARVGRIEAALPYIQNDIATMDQVVGAHHRLLQAGGLAPPAPKKCRPPGRPN